MLGPTSKIATGRWPLPTPHRLPDAVPTKPSAWPTAPSAWPLDEYCGCPGAAATPATVIACNGFERMSDRWERVLSRAGQAASKLGL